MDNMQDTVYQFSDQIFTPLRRFRGSESFRLLDETQNPIPVSEASADSEESLK